MEEQPSKSSSRGRGSNRSRGNRTRPQNNPRNASNQNTEDSNQNSDSVSHTNRTYRRVYHSNRENNESTIQNNSEENDPNHIPDRYGDQRRNVDSSQAPSSSSNRGRRGATFTSNTTKSTVQSSRGRGRRQRPDFLILHGENTTFLKNMKNSHNHQSTQQVDEEPEEEDANDIKCPFCTLAKPRLSGVKLQAITNCSHIMCFECALRWYFLSSQVSCPFCRQELSKIIITNRLNSDHSNIQQLMYEYTHNIKLLSPLTEISEQNRDFETSLIFIDSAKGSSPLPMSIREIINSVLNFECKICVKRNVRNVFRLDIRFKSEESLQLINDHLRKDHRSTLCELCFINLDGFASEYQIFGENELQLHRKYGTKTADKTQLGPHPCCHLCDPVPTYYYNLDALENHCKTIHCSCYVCTQTIFFRDPNALRKHIEENHMLCTICADTTNQVLGFGTVAEYRRHVEQEHPNSEFDVETLSARVRQPFLNFDPFNPDGDGDEMDGEMTDRMANDQIDNILRQSFQANQHEFYNSSNVENYVMNFPSIQGLTDGERLLPTTQTVHVFPNKKCFVGLGGKKNYEQDFPEMGPSTSNSSSLPGPSAASISAIGNRSNVFNISKSFIGKSKPRKVEFHSRPLSNVSIDGQQSQPSASWVGKKPKASTSNTLSSSKAKPSIFDDFIEGDSDGITNTAPVKPPTISLIEKVDDSPNPLQRPQRAPKKEDFPSLDVPSSSKKNHNSNNHSGLSGWSKVTAPEPEVKGKKAKDKKNKTQSANALETKIEKINLNDGSSFPSLSKPETSKSSTQSQKIGSWGVAVPAKNFNRNCKISDNTANSSEYFVPPNSSGDSNDSNNNNGGYFFQYVSHKNDDKRMRELLKSVRTYLSTKGQEESSSNFKQDWICFQNDGLTGKELFQKHLKLLDGEFYEKILCDLITLTPNIAKQHSLNDVWQQYHKHRQDKGLADSGPNRNAPYECDVCAQFILPSEKVEHSRFHTQTGLTALSGKYRRK